MQQKKEEKRQVEDTTTSYLKSIAQRYQYNDKILGYFIDVETGYCLDCGLVHSFHNLDEAIRREYRRLDNEGAI